MWSINKRGYRRLQYLIRAGQCPVVVGHLAVCRRLSSNRLDQLLPELLRDKTGNIEYEAGCLRIGKSPVMAGTVNVSDAVKSWKIRSLW